MTASFRVKNSLVYTILTFPFGTKFLTQYEEMREGVSGVMPRVQVCFSQKSQEG